MNVYQYIVSANPVKEQAKKVIDLLIKNGYNKPKDETQAEQMLRHFVKKGGEKALKAVMDLHPDKDYFLGDMDEKFKEFCACRGADGEVSSERIVPKNETKYNQDLANYKSEKSESEVYRRADGDKPKLWSDKTIQTVIIASSVLIGIGIIVATYYTVKTAKVGK